MKIGYCCATIVSLLLAACAAPTPREPLKGHLGGEPPRALASSAIPAPVQQPLALPKPRQTPKAETYSVVVNNVQVHDLLFALARDAKVNIDIHPGITGVVSLNAIDQTLPQILTRIAKQVDMRFELDGPNLSVMPDSPFLKHYHVDYMNMSRRTTATVSTNTQIATGVGGNMGGGVGGGVSGGGNISNTRIENTTKNQFWETLEKNIKDLLRETDKILPEGSSETFVEQNNEQFASGAAALPQSGRRAAQAVASALQTNAGPTANTQQAGTAVYRTSTFREAASVIINAETGVVTVRATQRQHDRIQEFIDRVANAARRQVLIEATIVEVTLNDGYQQGIDWTGLVGSGTLSFSSGSTNTLIYNRGASQPGSPATSGLVTLLDSFGTTKVLSSPRLSVLNNQTALLKVVEDYVYFNVKADTTMNTNIGQTTYTTTPQSVSVGLVISVTPQISDGDAITLNVRPTITSVAGVVPDPNPDLKAAGIDNNVPIIRTKEIESVMRVASGSIAILGGLMEDKIDYQNQRVPVFGQVPLFGELLNKRNNQAQKTELVILLRPQVIRDASIDGDYANLRAYLPGDDFFAQPNEAQPFNTESSR